MQSPPRQHTIFPAEFPESWASDWGEDEYGLFMGFTYKGVRQLFRWCEPGKFLMGSPKSEPERFDDETQHGVTLTQGFWIAETTVTQALWEAVMGGNPSEFTGDNRPVEQVSWEEAQNFIDKMNGLKPELSLCLPTEAQWEYACRAGTDTPFFWGEQISSESVNFNGEYPYDSGEKSEYREETVDVESFEPNAWGLWQMHGNVLEWCRDWFDDYSAGSVVDPAGPESGNSRVLRGGSWFNLGRGCRSAYRNYGAPSDGLNVTGFRLARGSVAAGTV